jgi:ribosome assembly protein 4
VTSAAKKPVEAATDDADDGEVCFICASPVEHTSVSPCNHRTCHICALRLRALYKNKACAHCRVCPSCDCSLTVRVTIG